MAKTGRPPMYETPEDMQKVIDEYFDWCDNRVKVVYDKKSGSEISITHPAPYTMSGLARHLGMSRRALVDYKKKSKFLPTIKEARERVQEDVETRLMETRNQTGAIFNLKNNFNWKEKTVFAGDEDNPITAKVEITDILSKAYGKPEDYGE